MHLYEKTFDIAAPLLDVDGKFFSKMADAVLHELEGEVPVRFVVPRSTVKSLWTCEIGSLVDYPVPEAKRSEIFQFVKRDFESNNSFNAVFIVPTGIGCEIGGHAGDATPAVLALASACDWLITHPNTVNASDINEIPANGLFVEGSVLARFMMGTVGLQVVRSNRVLTVMDTSAGQMFQDYVVNSVSAARSIYGLRGPGIIKMPEPIKMHAKFTNSGRAAGVVDDLGPLFKIIEDHRGEFDALAIASIIELPIDFHKEYFGSKDGPVNPWGGVEAILTHAISLAFDVPSAHAPITESKEIEDMSLGIVDPRMGAEAVSVAFIQCVLKGLKASPRIIRNPSKLANGTLTATDISCLVIPDGALGIPTLAALAQGIPVIAVEENRTILDNDLDELPWADDQFFRVKNYWEAAGVMLSLKAGLDPHTLRRPLDYTVVR